MLRRQLNRAQLGDGRLTDECGGRGGDGRRHEGRVLNHDCCVGEGKEVLKERSLREKIEKAAKEKQQSADAGIPKRGGNNVVG